MKIYLASSWRNEMQPAILAILRAAKFEVYDFRHPKEGDDGFSWKEIGLSWKNWTLKEYLKALSHPIADDGFKSDFDAMKWADCCVLLLPCGRSAHLEGGWFAGAGKPLHILLSEDNFEPELMYKMATSISTDHMELLAALGVKD